MYFLFKYIKVLLFVNDKNCASKVNMHIQILPMLIWQFVGFNSTKMSNIIRCSNVHSTESNTLTWRIFFQLIQLWPWYDAVFDDCINFSVQGIPLSEEHFLDKAKNHRRLKQILAHLYRQQIELASPVKKSPLILFVVFFILNIW